MFNIKDFIPAPKKNNTFIHQGASVITFIYTAIISFVYLILLIFDHLILSLFTEINIKFIIQAGLHLLKTLATNVIYGLWLSIFSLIMIMPYNYFGNRRLVYSTIAIVGFIVASKIILIVFILLNDFEFMKAPFSSFYIMSFIVPFIYLWLLSRIEKFEKENLTSDWVLSERIKIWLAHCLFMKNVSNKQKITIKVITNHGKSTALKEGKNQIRREFGYIGAALVFGLIIAFFKIVIQQSFKVGEYLNPARFATDLDYNANLLFMWFMDSIFVSILAFLLFRLFSIALFIIGKFIQFRNTSLEMGLFGGTFFSIISFAIMLGASFYSFEGVLFYFFNPLTLFIIGFVFGVTYKLSLPKPPMPIINASG